MRFPTILVLSCAVLAGCMGSGSQDDTTAEPKKPEPTVPPAQQTTLGRFVDNADGSVTVTMDGKAYQLPKTNVTFNGAPSWQSNGNRATTLPGTSGSALVGYQNSTALAALSGTRAAPSRTGSAKSESTVAVYSAQGSSRGKINLDIDFAANTVKGQALDGFNKKIAVDSKIDGANLNGTLTYDGEGAAIDGGFYGTNELAGVAKGKSYVAGFAGSY